MIFQSTISLQEDLYERDYKQTIKAKASGNITKSVEARNAFAIESNLSYIEFLSLSYWKMSLQTGSPTHIKKIFKLKA